MRRAWVWIAAAALITGACQPPNETILSTVTPIPFEPTSTGFISPPPLEEAATPTSEPPSESAITIPSCGEAIDQPLFSVSPLPEEAFLSIIPLGNLNPPSHTFPTDHVYFFLTRSDPNDPESVPAVTPVYAPGHAWISAVSAVEHTYTSPPYTDYTIRFSPCRELEAYFIHMSSLSGRLMAALADEPEPRCQENITGGNRYRYCEYWGLSIEIQSGQEIGTAGGRSGQNALDMGAMDARVEPLAYANPSRLYTSKNGIDPLHVVCPVDYFTQELRQRLRARLGYGVGGPMRTIEPVCGEVMHDIPGTAQGKWYLQGTSEPFPEDRHLALVHDNIDPTTEVFSVGTSIPDLDSGRYPFKPQDEGLVNRRFSQVTPNGSVFCYDEIINRFGPPESRLEIALLINLIDPDTLRIERLGSPACGSGPWTFTDGAVIFER